MARLARLALDGQLHHLVHRAPPGGAISLVDADRADLLDALLTVSREARVAIHAYVVLGDRLQLLLTPERGADLVTMMQRLGRRYVGAFNARHARSGSPWHGRYRSTVLQAERYLIDAMRQLEAAPVVAGLVEQADLWPASSAAHHFGRRVDPLVTDHPGYWQLGNTPFEREAAYRHLSDSPVAAASSTAIQHATERGWALGDTAFLEALGKQQARRLQPNARGRRPHKPPVHESDPI
jgi:putative transposase